MNGAKKSLVGGSKPQNKKKTYDDRVAEGLANGTIQQGGEQRPMPGQAAAQKIDTSNEAEFEKAKQIGGPAFNSQPLTGNIFVPTGAGVTQLIQKNGQPPVVGFTFTLSEYHQPLTFVLSKADAAQMKEMLDAVLAAG